MDILLIGTGALVGLLVGLVGVGGGAITMPILLLGFGINPALAVGTDLWFAFITKLVACRSYQKQGSVDWAIVKKLTIGSLSGILCTIAYLHHQAITPQTQEMLKMMIAIIVLVTAVSILFQGKIQQSMLGGFLGKEGGNHRWRDSFTFIGGSIIGVLVAMTSVGAGTLGNIVILFLYPKNMTAQKLIATNLAHAVPIAVVAAMGHLFIGNVDVFLLCQLLLGSVPAVWIGSKLAINLSHKWLNSILAIVLLFTGSQMLTVV